MVEQPVKGAAARDSPLDGCDGRRAEIGDVDLLYVDPPYNSRQYVAYYHIPRSWHGGGRTRPRRSAGKVGLLAGDEGRSQWSHGRRVKKLFAGLLSATGAKHAWSASIRKAI